MGAHVFRCKYCRGHVQWLRTRFAKSVLFDAIPVPVSLVPRDQTGWIPGTWTVKGGERIVMAPLNHYGSGKQERVTHVALPHACAQYEQFKAEIQQQAPVSA